MSADDALTRARAALEALGVQPIPLLAPLFTLHTADTLERVEIERWEIECQHLGATVEQVRAYLESAKQYAATSAYPTRLVVEEARRVALDMLRRGEPMPEDAQAALKAEWERAMVRLLEGGYLSEARR